MKRAARVLVPPLTLDSRRPFAGQIADGLRIAIRTGRLKHGGRLPATRRLAATLGISRQVVVAAYEMLLSDGEVVGRVGDGSYVAQSALTAPPRPDRVVCDPDGYTIAVCRLVR